MENLKILLASNNKNKLIEYKELFSGYNITFLTPKDLNIVEDIEETGKNYKQNALIKAKFYKKMTNLIILSDDSGIEINSIGFRKPGIYSHRYAIKLGGQENANQYLIHNCYNSRAHFTCCICLLNVTNKPLYFIGKVKGIISTTLEGQNGFGYDPIFIVKKINKTMSSLTNIEKNSISHRGNASRKVIEYLLKNNLIS